MKNIIEEERNHIKQLELMEDQMEDQTSCDSCESLFCQ
jgi:hypothetical protein